MSRPAEFAGLSLDRPHIMGILNVTPDSFSDGGRFLKPERAITQGLKLVGYGADILDIGGESTRPGAEPITIKEELNRIVPVLKGLRGAEVPISIDTRHAEVMEVAVAEGASIINDITALTGDPNSLATVTKLKIPVILSHMQGIPKTMQLAPTYKNVVTEIYEFFTQRISVLESCGVPLSSIAIDPGIGFGKHLSHNIEILKQLNHFSRIKCALVLGASRKSFIGDLDDNACFENRLGGSIASMLSGVSKGVNIVRVHDVFETRQALSVWSAVETYRNKL